MEPTGNGYAFCCPYCDVRGFWRIERHGDVVVSWACISHLALVCEGLMRPGEKTSLSVMMMKAPVG